MPRVIQIRNVPDEVHRKLKIRAAEDGVTLSELLVRSLTGSSDNPRWKSFAGVSFQARA